MKKTIERGYPVSQVSDSMPANEQNMNSRKTECKCGKAKFFGEDNKNQPSNLEFTNVNDIFSSKH